MATEKAIERVLDLLTKAPSAEIESLAVAEKGHALAMRRIVKSRNVVGIGISEKVTQKEKTGKLALTFYVQKKVSLKKLRAEVAVPPTVPESLSGPEAIPCDVVVVGKIKPEANPLVTHNPIQPGYSIGHVDITAGTLGGIVSKGDEFYLLSNSHVLAVSGTAKKGDAIVYPGKADGGDLPDDLIARLADFKKFAGGGEFVNRVDCAIAKPTAARLADVTSEIKGLGVPKGKTKAVRGMKVVKVGRTTRKTVGEVRDVHFRFTLNYEEVGEVGFIDQVLCTRYTKPGDSGSLVMDQETGKAVGLHFAGANGGSVFNPIDDVLQALGVTLVTKLVGNPQLKAPKRKVAKKAGKKAKSAGKKS